MRRNMRFKVIISIALIFIMNIGTIAQAYSLSEVPSSIVFNTKDNRVGRVLYEDLTRQKNQRFYLEAKQIVEDNGQDIAYCLDIEKSYPSGEVFTLSGDPLPEVRSLIAAGYPSRTPEQLNLKTSGDAYFATQIALWCYLEGYDVYKIHSDNAEVVSAIRSIYNDGVKGVATSTNYYIKDYFTNDKVQNIVVAFKSSEEIKLPTLENDYIGK